jgi:phospholipid/cholesterol/gamma-HCH transport system ATP-binding protein
MSETVVSIHDLHKSFDSQVVLDGVNLEVHEAECFVILGRSGTGKSVLLKLVVALLQPDSGTIRIFGEEIHRLKSTQINKLRKRIGFLFQFSALFDSMTVEENVTFPLLRSGSLSDAECRDRANQLLARVGMQDAVRKLPSDISGGMKKRVGLARALALDPELVLLDEPTAGLDPVTATEIVELIRELQEERKITSIVVTHDIHSARRISTRVAMLNDGNFPFEGNFAELEKSEIPEIAAYVKQAFFSPQRANSAVNIRS